MLIAATHEKVTQKSFSACCWNGQKSHKSDGHQGKLSAD